MLLQLLRQLEVRAIDWSCSDAPYCWSTSLQCCPSLFWTRTLPPSTKRILHRLSGRYLHIAPVYLQGCTRPASIERKAIPCNGLDSTRVEAPKKFVYMDQPCFLLPNDPSLVLAARVRAYYSVGSLTTMPISLSSALDIVQYLTSVIIIIKCQAGLQPNLM